MNATALSMGWGGRSSKLGDVAGRSDSGSVDQSR